MRKKICDWIYIFTSKSKLPAASTTIRGEGITYITIVYKFLAGAHSAWEVGSKYF